MMYITGCTPTSDTEKSFLALIAYTMITLGVLTYFSLRYVTTAPYGRYNTADRSVLYGFNVNSRLSWFLQELPAFVAVVWCLSCVPLESLGTHQRVLLALYGVHYFHRTFIFPFRIRSPKPSSALSTALAVAFNVCNGYLQARWITGYGGPALESVPPAVFVAGMGLALAGMAINIHSDSVLMNLRKPGETGYKIPRGGMFEYVSGANFFGEITEWVGYALASGFALPPLAFAVFTFCNIGPRALQHHQWYLLKFKEDYPTARKALFPFVW